MKITRKCLHCGNEFSTYLSKQRVKLGHGKFCSKQCNWEYIPITQTGKKKLSSRRTWPKEEIILSNGSIIHWDKSFYRENHIKVHVTCGRCRKSRTVFGYNVKKQTFKAFCQKCSRRENSLSGENHKNWKGGITTTKEGYVQINIRSLSGRRYEIASQMARVVHGKSAVIMEHRLLVAEFLDRPLLSSEHIHHKNGIKNDNKLENLELLTPSEHAKIEVTYYDLYQKALEDIRILKEQVPNLEKIGLSSPS